MLVIVLIFIVFGGFLMAALDNLNQAVTDLKTSIDALVGRVQVLENKAANTIDPAALDAAAADIQSAVVKLNGLAS
jgi:uncharacterized protein YoxC